ncbi:hypothetical protein F7725_014444 [Dissostichus mawsoni]|uniref:protein-tyrosine-phosphatase n=1 Tax=Dissostichus mawsoni TaxID=36200 RepID=A0A7J5YWF4_DISMA|nr:hypothetical protein F7725_014444 [Dissostichus mawsoni]
MCFALTQGYRQKDYFIATQGPLTHTLEDFWRMVWEWKCHSIVMLTELQEREQGQMLPLLASRGLYHLRKLQVELKETLCVTPSVYETWYSPLCGEADQGDQALPLPRLARGRTGTFIALSNILERVKAEGLLDVFQTVKSLRMQRPHMVQTVVSIYINWIQNEQYDFCYRVVQDFVDIFSDYANFK